MKTELQRDNKAVQTMMVSTASHLEWLKTD